MKVNEGGMDNEKHREINRKEEQNNRNGMVNPSINPVLSLKGWRSWQDASNGEGRGEEGGVGRQTGQKNETR